MLMAYIIQSINYDAAQTKLFLVQYLSVKGDGYPEGRREYIHQEGLVQ